MSDNNSEFGAFLAGFVIGGLVGAATALILAPQSGEQTRGQISSKSGELRESGEQRIHQYRELSTEKVQDYQNRAAHLLHRDEVKDEVSAEQTRIVLDDGTEQIETITTSEDSTDEA
jgi:gas vesicle protein